MATFKEYPAIEIPEALVALGFEDASYRNDACARMEGPSDLSVWVAESDPAEREVANAKQFTVTHGEGQTLLFECEAVEPVVAKWQTRRGWTLRLASWCCRRPWPCWLDPARSRSTGREI
jgi:hypothetical protein